MHSPGYRNKSGHSNPQESGDATAAKTPDEAFSREDGFYDAGDIAQVKYEMLRYVANGHSIDEAVRTFGFSSRRSFYQARADFERAGLAGLIPRYAVKLHGQMEDEADEAQYTPHIRLDSIVRTHERMQEELQGSGAPLARAFISDHLEIDFIMRKVRVGKKNVHLTPKEFDLLRYLVSQARRAVPHKELLRAVWGPEFIDHPECLRVCITHLRKKVEPDPSEPRYILTEPWVGYRFVDCGP
ncbi:MAG TPA: winged helix-turn-helix domain-containing protein [Terriglobia bacterium]|jgi:hypothetical protein